MLNFIKRLFGIKSVDFKALIKEGAVIVDVCTATEFEVGHIPSSKNIPLQSLKNELAKLNNATPIITCCASGVRSISAKEMLSKNGFVAYNGGSWQKLQEKISD